MDQKHSRSNATMKILYQKSFQDIESIINNDELKTIQDKLSLGEKIDEISNTFNREMDDFNS